MKRRFNYTGRKRILRDRIDITLNKDGNLVRSAVFQLNLREMNLLQDASVYVEAYQRMAESRISRIGIVNEGDVMGTIDLSTCGYDENLKFRIYVVNESGEHGLILAHADRIKPEQDVNRKTILPILFKDIGQQIWKIVYEGDGCEPLLLLNRGIPAIETIAKNDAQFIMFVYPAVLKEVLKHMVFVDGIDSLSDPQTDWHKDWLNLTRYLIGEEPPNGILKIENEISKNGEALKWIDKVVEGFCNSRSEWSIYITQSSVKLEE